MTFIAIRNKLEEEGYNCTRQSIAKFWRVYQATGQMKARHGGGRVLKLNDEHLAFLDHEIMQNRELSAKELCSLLETRFGVVISEATLLR